MNLTDDLQDIIQRIFEANNFKYSTPITEIESADYHAYDLSIEGRSIKYRLAKKTPTKNGQFVTLWKRIHNGSICPYDCSDEIDIVVVTVKAKDNLGLFIFPKKGLAKHGVISVNKKGGKRAFRVYPPWDKASSKQAEKSQKWQLDFFLDFSKNKSIDLLRCRNLFSL